MIESAKQNSTQPAPVRTSAVLATGSFTAALGFLTLLGWALGAPRLTSLGPHLIPMSPSAALLFLLFGGAVCLRARPMPGRPAIWLSAAMVASVALIAFGLFVLACRGIHWDGEHLGFSISDTLNGVPIGHMSLVTALCFLFSSLSFSLSLVPPAACSWRIWLTAGAAVLVLAISFVFLLGYIFGSPLLYGSTLIPPALNTILAFMTLGLALLLLAGRSLPWQPAEAPLPLFLLAIMTLGGLGIIAAGYFYYRSSEQYFRRGAERELLSICELKIAELAHWHRERLGDGHIFSENPAFAALVKRSLTSPADETAQLQLKAWIDNCQATYGYDHWRLLDSQGVTRLSLPEGLPPASASIVQSAAAVLRSSQTSMLDFYRDDFDHRIYLKIEVPIFDDTAGKHPLGVLLLRVDPATFLYPYIQRWPTPSESGETLLVRREGGEVVYLNALRFQSDSALNLRIPLAQTATPAVKAAIGQTGIMQGLDYRGVPVLAAAIPVPGTPWVLVAKVDLAEIDAPLRARMWGTLLFIGVFLGGAGAGVGLHIRRQRVAHLRERLAAAEAMGALALRNQTLLQAASDGVHVLDDQGRVFEANPAFCRMLGYTREEVLQLSVTDWDVQWSGEEIFSRMREMMAGAEIFVSRHRRKDGTFIDVEISGVGVTLEGRNYVYASARDITAHKKAVTDLMRSREQQRALSVHLQSLRETERTRIAREIHDELGQMLTGLKMDLQAAENHLEELKDARLNPILDQLVAATEVADATITSVQRIASELRPGVLDRLGLMQTLRHEIDQFQQRTGIACQLHLPDEEPLISPEVATTFYRIFQEALTNVARHAAARTMQVRFHSADGKFTLEVQDDGRGMNEAAPAQATALGLLGMQERAHLNGGTVTFRPGAAGGTIVSVRLPRRQPPPAYDQNPDR